MGLTLLFDIDGTLLRTGGAGLNAMEKAANELFQVPRLTRVPVHGRTDTGIVKELFEVNQIEHSANNRQRFIELYLKLLPDSLHKVEGRLLPGVPQLLEGLQAKSQVRIGLLTGNMESAAWMKLKHFGISEYFEFGGFGDIHADRNLVAQQALDAALTVGHQPSDRLFVIGDTPNDVRCGRHINANVIAVMTGGAEPSALKSANADWLMDDLSNHDHFYSAIGL